MFRTADKLGYIRKNPMKDVPLGIIEKRTRFFNQEETRQILFAAQKDEYSYALALFFLQTGFRIEEVSDSFWENINHEARTIAVVGKYKKQWIQKIQIQTYEAIMQLERQGKSIFMKKQRQLSRDLMEILNKAGIKGSSHDFRRTYASYSMKFMDIVTLRDRLGHSNLKQTSDYAQAIHFRIDDDIKALFNDWEIRDEM